MKYFGKQLSYYTFIIYVLCVFITSCKSGNTAPLQSTASIQYTSITPQIDGEIDKQWSTVDWQPIDQLWLGENLSETDFTGVYKTLWHETGLFVLAKITDDILIDSHDDPLEKYWDDDCLEIFIDEDASKGNHQYNHNAFAYHIALDQKVADIGPDQKPHLYPNNVSSIIKPLGNNQYLWEVKLNMYKDDFVDDKPNKPIMLKANQDFGFAIAYCDNDSSPEREHFIGSSKVEGEDKNRGWIDAGIFGQYKLVK